MKEGQKAFKRQRKGEFVVRLCLLKMSEAIVIRFNQNDYINMKGTGWHQ